MSKWFSTPPACTYGHLIRVPFSSFTAPSHASFADAVAIIYSLVPVLLVLSTLLYAVLRRTFSYSGVFLLLFFVHFPVTEILKQIIKNPRPLGSCNSNYGMPSGHSFAAVSVFIYLVLWLFSISRDQRLKSPQKVVLLVLGMAVLLPVPWARVQLRDHSIAQVSVGAVLGALWGGIWFCIQDLLVQKINKIFEKKPKKSPTPDASPPVLVGLSRSL